MDIPSARADDTRTPRLLLRIMRSVTTSLEMAADGTLPEFFVATVYKNFPQILEV